MKIRRLKAGEPLPWSLLLLADPSEKLVQDYCRRGTCYVAEDEEGTIIGEYVLVPTRPDTVELVNVAVEEAHQGKKIGKQLVSHAVATAKKEGYKTIEVGTGNSGANQLMLYQKCGFRITHVDRDFFVRHYEEPIEENGLPCVDMIRLSQDI
ncbi:GNAT family N-acetyltransferase [Shouchella tritolerans]|uniref:GNAT family N-acetyltransferase n=1 Tax=Shouchella tritolerans TaxID=2979466 RepID=UPI0007887A1B|nr:GNAT family N-acetyltransferase [Shouchella tritolerans]